MGLDLDMGRYAAFVWPAFALSALVIGALVADTPGARPALAARGRAAGARG